MRNITKRVLWYLSRNIIRIVIPLLIKTSIFFKRPWIINYPLLLLIKICTKYWNFTNKITKKNHNLKKILFFGREIFNTDIKNICLSSKQEFIFFPQIIYNTIADTFIPPEIRSQIGYHLSDIEYEGKYINKFSQIRTKSLKDYEKCKAKLSDFIDNYIFNIIYKLNIGILVTANVQYYQDQEWIKICKQKNIPFIAMVKEGIGTKNDTLRQIDTFKQMNFKFLGHKVTCYSYGVREILTKSGVCNESLIEVLGCARTDLIFKTNMEAPFLKNKKRKLIVIFDFFEYATDNASLGSSKINLWNENIDHIIKLARLNDEFDFIIKTKDQSFSNSIRHYFADSKNIIITHDYGFDQIVKNALCIMGFRSTSLIKLLHTDIPIGIFASKNDLISNDEDFMFELRDNNAFNLLSNYNDIKVFIEQSNIYLIKGISEHIVKDRKKRNSIIGEHLLAIDGKRSRKISDFLLKIVDN